MIFNACFLRNKWLECLSYWKIERPSYLINILQNCSIRNFSQVIVVMLKYAASSLFIKLIKQEICQDSYI